MELNQVTRPVTDVPRAIAFYCRLGFRQIVDASHYARFECRPDGPSFSVHLSSAPLSNEGVLIYSNAMTSIRRSLGCAVPG